MINKLVIALILFFFGCTDPLYPDPNLPYEKVYGCTISTACNFNPSATTFDDSCFYLSDLIDEGYCDCDSNIIDDCGDCGGGNEGCNEFASILLTDEFSNVLGYEGIEGNHSSCIFDRSTTSITPTGFFIQVYPNPFASATTLSFSVEESIEIGVKVIDINYNNVDVLYELGTIFNAGHHGLSWDGSDFPDGYYRFILTFENVDETDAEISVPSECYYNIKKGSF